MDLPRSRLDNPEPQTCHGRGELETALPHQTEQGLQAHLEEVKGRGDKVMVVVHTPGLDADRVRHADDRDYSVFALQRKRIVALRDCHDRDEALRYAGIE